MERDEGKCIICGSHRNLQIAHFISRGRLGLGIPQNLGVLCQNCHFQYDNGQQHRLYESAFKAYLRSCYDDWDSLDLTYHKRG